MSVTVKIANVDRTTEIDWKSLQLQRALTNQTDTLSFTIKRSNALDYKPALLDDVQLIEGSTTLFGGNIITMDEEVDGRVEYVRITCKDYSFDLDRELVIDTYENMTVNSIVKNIIGVGNALQFDGVNDYAESGSNVNIQNITFSISLWFKRSRSATLEYLLSTGSASNNNGLQIGFKATDVLTVSFFGLNAVDSVATYTDTNWHHLVITYNATTNARKAYVDGALVASDTASADFGGLSHLFVGAGLGGSASWFKGYIDEVLVYNTELSASAILAAYNRGAGKTAISDATMIAGYHLDETSGTTADDFAASNDLTLNGGMGSSNWVAGVVSEKGFTINNVNCLQVVKYIAFNYEQTSKCIQQLVQLFEYDWYVDENKDIHVFSKVANPAPFALTDSSANYIYNSLKIKNDIKNLKNSIIVRGGIYQGNTTTETQNADGVKTTFLLAYQYANISVTKGGVSQTIGIDFIDDPASFDVLYNFQEKAIKFRSDNKPANGVAVAITGNPYIPVIVKVKDPVSVSQFGEYQAKIVDKSINSKEGARDRAKAEIQAWADSVNEGSFSTITTGLDVGQLLNISSTIRNFNNDYVISRITSKMYTPTSMKHDITLVTSQTFGMVEFLQKLLMDKDKEIEINENEVSDEVESVYEEIVITESVSISIVHNTQLETITLADVATVQALNYPTRFVVGPWNPTTSSSYVRTNLIKNPSFEVNVTDETALENNLSGGTAVLSRDATTAPSGVGSASAKVVITTPANSEEWRVKVRMNETAKISVTKGKTYTISLYMKALAARNVKIALETAGGAFGYYSGSLALTTSWQRFTYTFTATQNDTAMTFNAILNDGTSGTINLDGAMVAAEWNPEPYFDGSTSNPATKTHAWSGTANNSTSTETITDAMKRTFVLSGSRLGV